MKNSKIVLALALLSFNCFVGARTMNVDSSDALVGVSATAKFRVSVFDRSTNMLYLGDTNAPTNEASVVRVSFADKTPVVTNIGFGGLSGKAIRKLDTLDNGDLLVLPADSGNNAQNFYVIKNPSGTVSASNVFTSPVAQDAAPANSKFIQVVSVGQTSDGMMRIAAVIPTATNNDLRVGANQCLKLYVYDGANIVESSMPAYSLNTATATQNFLGYVTAALGQTSGGVGAINLSGMLWDPVLQRLYFGVEYTSASTNGTNRSLLAVATFTESNGATTITVDKFSPASANATTANVLAFPTNTAQPYKLLSIQLITSQAFAATTSGAGNYLVACVQQNAVANAPAKCVYAFPVADATITLPGADYGKAAQVSGGTITRTAAATTALETFATAASRSNNGGSLQDSASYDVRSMVGGAPLPVLTGDSIIEMKTIADMVVVICAESANTVGQTTSAEGVGVFVSSPVYAVGGEIAGWTPWVRAYSSGYGSALTGNRTASTNGVVWSASLDKDLNLVFVAGSQDGATVNVVGKTNWTKAVSNYNPLSAASLATKLATDFSSIQPWIAKQFRAAFESAQFKVLGVGAAGLSIVAGNNKVAFINSGMYAAAANGAYQDLTSAAQYLVKDCAVGAAYCAEVARIAGSSAPYPNTHGFVFVGGENGLYVLCDSTGAGYNVSDPVASLTNLSTTFANMSFLKVAGINEPVHALHSTQRFLYALTKKSLYRIRLHSNSGDIIGATAGVKFAQAATMFAPASTGATTTKDEVMLEVSADLSNVTATSMVAANALSNQSYTSDVLVIQKMMDAGSAEFFIDMVGMPNNAAVFVASIKGSSSCIYTLNGDEAAGANVITEPAYTLSYYVRKLALRHVNYHNLLLNDAANTPGWIDGATGFYSAADGVIGNLIVVEGDSISKSSALHLMEIKGKVVKTTIANGTGNETFYRTTLMATVNTSRALNEIAKNSTKYAVLPNAIDEVMSPGMIYGSAYQGRAVASRIMNSSDPIYLSQTTTRDNADTGLTAVIHAYNLLRLESGAMLLLTDKGPIVYE